MYPYIVCFGCGKSIGDYFDLYKEMRRQRYVEHFGDYVFDPTVLATVDSLGVDTSDIFKTLHLDSECCRARMMTQVEFKELY